MDENYVTLQLIPIALLSKLKFITEGIFEHESKLMSRSDKKIRRSQEISYMTVTVNGLLPLEDDVTLQLIPTALLSKMKSVIGSIFKHEPVLMHTNEKWIQTTQKINDMPETVNEMMPQMSAEE